MPNLFDGTDGLDDIIGILDRMEANCPQPRSTSQSLWKLRRATKIAPHNASKETMLEKGVAILAETGQMPSWFNQCPTASGIGGSSDNKHSSIDLVHWVAEDRPLTLIELKWGSNSPSEAVQQILRYGAAYLFCRKYRALLPVGERPAMAAKQVVLQVVAPARYYNNDRGLPGCLDRARKSLEDVPGRTGLPELSMSLDVLAFPDWFNRLPFATGAEVHDVCCKPEFEQERRKVIHAFDGLTSVFR